MQSSAPPTADAGQAVGRYAGRLPGVDVVADRITRLLLNAIEK